MTTPEQPDPLATALPDDQAAGLRRLAGARGLPPAPGRLHCIAIGSGKGGVGKTALCVNLSYCLARMNRKVLLLDADLGLANVDIQMGIEPARTLQDVVFGHCAIEEAVVHIPDGPDILPSSSGTPEMADMGNARRQLLSEELLRFAAHYDFLLIDTGAGIGKGVTTFLASAPEVLVVVANEPTSIMDAYSLIKVLHRERPCPRIRIVANMVRSLEEGERLAERLQGITQRFLGMDLPLAGSIPFDQSLRDAIRTRRPLINLAPGCAAIQCVEDLARSLIADRRGARMDPAASTNLFSKLVDVAVKTEGTATP
jgi:flagellar biosynthesis protein FlhG